MTQDEFNELYKKMQDPNLSHYFDLILSWNHRNIPNPYMNGVSPTQPASRGQYAYQEPEIDEQGTYYGYKVLHRINNGCGCERCSTFYSPRYCVRWIDGEIESDHLPENNTSAGIHCTKRQDHSALASWFRAGQGVAACLVKCALSGTIIETEQGFRAQHAMIIGVHINGYWQSYQNYQERPCTYQNQNPYSSYTYKDW